MRNVRKRIATSLALTFALTFTACFGNVELAGPEGTWTLDAGRLEEMFATAVEDEIQAQLSSLSGEARAPHEEDLRREMSDQAALALAFLQTLSMDITLEPGHKWTRVTEILGVTEISSGTWQISGSALTLTTTEKEGQLLAEPTVEAARFTGDEIHYQGESSPVALILTRKR